MTIFEKILKGELPCHKIWEDQDYFAFLDIQPVAPGHSLVIPKKAVDPITRLSPDEFQGFWLAAYEVARLLEEKLSCERVCFSVVGFEVPHAHIHVIPCRSMNDFPWPGGKKTSPEELLQIADRIRSV